MKTFIFFEKTIIMTKGLKKYVAKYTLEFVFIVLGISVSFYINEAKKKLNNVLYCQKTYRKIFKRKRVGS
jgi:hypothetical protein